MSVDERDCDCERRGPMERAAAGVGIIIALCVVAPICATLVGLAVRILRALVGWP